MEQETIIIVSVFGAAVGILCIISVVLFVQVARLRKKVDDMQASGRIRVQKLKMNSDKNHAFRNPELSSEEELSRRGYSMYMHDDVETGRSTHRERERERQTGGYFVEDMTREEPKQQKQQQQQQQSSAPPFLLQSIEEKKSKNRSLNPLANGRQSDTNPNFIY